MNTNNGGVGDNDNPYYKPPENGIINLRVHAPSPNEDKLCKRVEPDGYQREWIPYTNNGSYMMRSAILTGYMHWRGPLGEEVKVYHARGHTTPAMTFDALLWNGKVMVNNKAKSATIAQLIPATGSGPRPRLSREVQIAMNMAIKRWFNSGLQTVQFFPRDPDIPMMQFIVQHGGGDGSVVPFGDKSGVVAAVEWFAAMYPHEPSYYKT